MSRATIAGVGGIAFTVLTVVAVLVASPPGGTYKESDIADFVAKGHHAAVFISLYLMILAVVGLFCLLARLRDAVAAEAWGLGPIFSGLSRTGAASFAIGWAVVVGVPLAMAYGGSKVSIEPTVTYTITEAGWAVFLDAGGMLLGFALIALVLGSQGRLPAWLRGATLIAGLGGVASPAFFPFFLLLIWGLVVGVWLLAGSRVSASSPAPQPGA